MKKSAFDRRGFLKCSGALAAAGWAGLPCSLLQAADGPKATPNAEKLGWHLGCQAWSFHQFTYLEAIEKTASLGLGYIEVFPGQQLSKDNKAKLGPELSAEDRAWVKKTAADHNVKIVGFGVTGLGKDETADRKVFDFAKDMALEHISAEPPLDAFDVIDKLAQEYQINVALHNHPEPSIYWNPDTVLKACEGRSKRIGACADIGHWMRSGIKPMDALKKLEGRIISFHFKDLQSFGSSGHDVPWGTGKANAKSLLTEIHRQGFKGNFIIEYEYNWDNSLPDIAKCAEFFDKVAGDLAG
jgi:sugar phosphate isomerase/epimerase